PRGNRAAHPAAGALMDGHEIGAACRVEQRIEERPVSNRVAAVLHALRLAAGLRDGARVEMIARHRDRPAELAALHQVVKHEARLVPLTEREPASARGEAL